MKTINFGSRLGVVSLLLLTVLPLAGCDSNDQKTASALIQVAGTAVASLEALEGNVALGTTLQKDFAAAATAVANWKVGTPAQDVVQALNVLDSDLDLIPVSDKDKALIELVSGTVGQIIDLLPASAPAVTASPVIYHTVLFFKPHKHPKLKVRIKTPKDFKKQWNALLAAHPEWSKAKAK